MEKPTVMSATQYAKIAGVSRQYIQRLLQKGKPLDGVKYYYKSGDGKTSHYILIME